MEIAQEGKIRLSDAEQRASENAHRVRPDRETGKHDHHGQELWRDQETDGADGHRFKRVDFFADLHGSNFGGEGGTGAADHDDGGDQGPEFARHGDGDGGGDGADGAESPQFVRRLQGENQPDEERNQRENRQRPNSRVHGLRNRALQPQRFPVKWSYQGIVGRARRERREGADVAKTVEGAFAYLSYDLHISGPAPPLRCRRFQKPSGDGTVARLPAPPYSVRTK